MMTRRQWLAGVACAVGGGCRRMDIARNWTADYEGGSAASVTQVSTDTYRIDLTSDPTRTWTFSYDATITGVAGRTLSFQIRYAWGSLTPYVEETPTTWRPVWTDDDGATWQRVAAVTWNSTTKVISFTLPRAIGNSGTVRLSIMGEPYGLQQYDSDMGLWLSTGYVTRTTIGTSGQGRPIYRLTVNDSSEAGAKAVIGHYRSGHETERPATWRVRHMVDWACGSSAEASAFRARNILHAIVMPNPDGVVDGLFRTNASGVEMNRWATSDGTTTGTPAAPNLSQEGTEQFAIHTDIEDNIAFDLFVDHHTAPTHGETLYYAPNHAALANMPISTYDTGGLIDTTTNDSWANNKFSHRVVASRLSCPAAIFDGGQITHADGSSVSPTSCRTVAIALLRACDDYLH